MRPIKFRGLRVEYNKEYGQTPWKYGNLLNNTSIGEVGEGLKHYSYSIVKPETVGQFTGFKDYKGIEIYEGDKISYFNKYSKRTFNHIVKWNDNLSCFALYEKDNKWAKEFDWISIQNIEVIGNIHEK